MFIPVGLAKQANNYVKNQDGNTPKFKRGVGIEIGPNAILRYCTTTLLSVKRVSTVGQAMAEGQARKRNDNLKRIHRVGKAA